MTPTAVIFQQAAHSAIQHALARELKRLRQIVQDCQGQGELHPQLHRLRVRTRRLRSILKSARPLLPPSLIRLQRAYGQLARATNQDRDHQVCCQQLQDWGQHQPELAAACQFLSAHFCAKVRYEPAESMEINSPIIGLAPKLSVEQLLARYHKRNQQLTKKLQQWHSQNAAVEPRLGAFLAQQIRQHALAWQQCWQTWQQGEAHQLHNMRLEVKRLRYLLMPWEKELKAKLPWLLELEQLQAGLGQLHDVQIQQQILQQWIPQAAAEVYQQLVVQQRHALNADHSAQEIDQSSLQHTAILSGLQQLVPQLLQLDRQHQIKLKPLLSQRKQATFMRRIERLAQYLESL